MRIIAGELKGRRLKTRAGLLTRPTSDKVKGAIFSTLGEKVRDASVLDLFAGTGNLALEALSRGARAAVLVENNREAQAVIRENIEMTGVGHKAKLISMDAFQYIQKNRSEIFDLIFLDPPYGGGFAQKAITLLKEKTCLTANGVIVAETAKDEIIEGEISPLEIRRISNYGDTRVWYLQRSDVCRDRMSDEEEV